MRFVTLVAKQPGSDDIKSRRRCRRVLSSPYVFTANLVIVKIGLSFTDRRKLLMNINKLSWSVRIYKLKDFLHLLGLKMLVYYLNFKHSIKH